MSFISRLKSLYRNLLDARRYAKSACRVIDLIVTEINKSNASAELKAQAVSLQTAAHALCAAIETYINDLPGNAAEE